MAHHIEVEDLVLTQKGDSRAWHLLDEQIDFASCDWVGRFDWQVQVKQLMAEKLLNAWGLVSDRAPSQLLRLCSSDTIVDMPVAVAQFSKDLCRELGANMRSALSLEHTSRLAFCMELPNSIRDLGNGDKLSQYVVVTGSYDGTHPWKVCFWNMRAVCNNTLPSATITDGVIWKSRNGKSERFTPKLASQIAALIHAIPAERMRKEQEVFDALLRGKIEYSRDVNRFAQLIAEDGAKLLQRVIVFQNPADAKASLLDQCLTATVDINAWKDLKVRAGDMTPLARKIVVNTLEGMGAELPTARDTAWGLLNAATQSFDHESRRDTGDQARTTLFQEFNEEKKSSLLLASAIANTAW